MQEYAFASNDTAQGEYLNSTQSSGKVLKRSKRFLTQVAEKWPGLFPQAATYNTQTCIACRKSNQQCSTVIIKAARAEFYHCCDWINQYTFQWNLVTYGLCGIPRILFGNFQGAIFCQFLTWPKDLDCTIRTLRCWIAKCGLISL